MRKKYIDKSEIIRNLKVEFCTECDEDLDQFDLNSSTMQREDIKKNFENCQKTGKFKGDMCSKLFISDEEDDFDQFLDAED